MRKLRTLLARDNTLILSFFRSQGMMAGPLIPLETGPSARQAVTRMKLQKNTSLALYSVLEFAARPERAHPGGRDRRQKYGESPHHLAKVLARAGARRHRRVGARRRRRLPLRRATRAG